MNHGNHGVIEHITDLFGHIIPGFLLVPVVFTGHDRFGCLFTDLSEDLVITLAQGFSDVGIFHLAIADRDNPLHGLLKSLAIIIRPAPFLPHNPEYICIFNLVVCQCNHQIEENITDSLLHFFPGPLTVFMVLAGHDHL